MALHVHLVVDRVHRLGVVHGAGLSMIFAFCALVAVYMVAVAIVAAA